MFDIDASEFLVIAVVAVVAIGPKDLPRAFRTAGRWIGTMRRVSGHFRAGVETMIRDAELHEQMERSEAAAPAADHASLKPEGEGVKPAEVAGAGTQPSVAREIHHGA
ncbi:Sec-independent protein translocase protein TatB [Novosphingobium sp. G106]|uniref:Sec-independent protein translocase protein TatB n=1 Tax=Novosphingobium sp. G106 TaxID=2849500 RepID=UPI001C2D9517|nr:Sec-independent protein translocase protein TatB [Novosphingobium sp. G106]MBV1692268.1 Sec-independent protein translocase protein TatB [Novosphingobium sp. G106]